jgi:hypothetical protein
VPTPLDTTKGETFETKYPRTAFENNAPVSGLSTDYTEPYADGYDGEDAEYQAMEDSVTKYQGFYVGRYEAGCETERTSDNKTTVQKVLVQQGKNVYNYVPWGNEMNDTGIVTGKTGDNEEYNGVTGAVELSKNFAIKNGYTGVTSTLIYGIQWDMMLRFVADDDHNVNDSSNWGNYNNSTGDAAVNSGLVQTTGKNEAWKAKNIYDIAGNVWEWTMEAYQSSARILRGGCYVNDGSILSAAYHAGSNEVVVSSRSGGFRVALYVK